MYVIVCVYVWLDVREGQGRTTQSLRFELMSYARCWPPLSITFLLSLYSLWKYIMLISSRNYPLACTVAQNERKKKMVLFVCSTHVIAWDILSIREEVIRGFMKRKWTRPNDFWCRPSEKVDKKKFQGLMWLFSLANVTLQWEMTGDYRTIQTSKCNRHLGIRELFVRGCWLSVGLRVENGL